GANVNAVSGSNIIPDVECMGTISGSGYNGARRIVTTPRTMPGSNVFDYYIANGTAIPVSLCTNYAGTKALNQLVLSPSINTLGGGTNANGIYVIDCQNQP